MMGRGYGYGYDMMGGYGWFGALLMFLFGAMIVVGTLLLIIWVVRASSHRPAAGGWMPPHAGHDESVAIARRRFASGEITKDQYDEIMRALSG